MANEMMTFTGENDAVVTPYLFDGVLYFIAKDVGAALGYANDGLKLTDRITGEWADEFIEGTDYRVLRGKNLSEFKALMRLTPQNGVSRARSLLLLTESGVNLVCMKTNKPTGVQMRRWLAGDLLPTLRRGDVDGVLRAAGHEAPKPDAISEKGRIALDRERRLMKREERLRAETLMKLLAMSSMGQQQRDVLLAHAASDVTGVPVVPMLPKEEKRWRLPSEFIGEIERDTGFTSGVGHLGKLTKKAGLTNDRESYDAALVEPVEGRRSGGDSTPCDLWRFSDAGVERARELAAEYVAEKAEAQAERERKRQERAEAKAKRDAEREAKRAAKAAGKSDIERARAARETPPALPGLDNAEDA